MGFALASITKAIMTNRVIKKLPKISTYACSSCSTLAAVKVFKDHIEIVRCKC